MNDIYKTDHLLKNICDQNVNDFEYDLLSSVNINTSEPYYVKMGQVVILSVGWCI